MAKSEDRNTFILATDLRSHHIDRAFLLGSGDVISLIYASFTTLKYHLAHSIYFNSPFDSVLYLKVWNDRCFMVDL